MPPRGLRTVPAAVHSRRLPRYRPDPRYGSRAHHDDDRAVARVASGSIVGTIAGHPRGTEGHLRGMAVLPECHGKGVSPRLLDAIERELADLGCTDVTLDTTAPLRRAVVFYTRNGYVATGTASDFFGMPIFEYRKRIAGEVASLT